MGDFAATSNHSDNMFPKWEALDAEACLQLLTFCRDRFVMATFRIPGHIIGGIADLWLGGNSMCDAVDGNRCEQWLAILIIHRDIIR